jgi:hypothetical protein
MLRSFACAAVAAALLSSACGRPSPNPIAPPPAAATPTAGPSTPPRLTPDEVVALVAARYPDRLAGDVTLDERRANMEFLRDRIIETGICGGLNLAWNRKANGLRSIDAINWRHGDEDRNDVVDLAHDYDSPDRALALHWHVTEGPAGWDPYPQPACPSH